jgi:HNH endonuclease
MNTPNKLCQCGCEAETTLDRNGEPHRFIRRHNRRNTGVGWLEQGRWYIRVDGKKKAFHRWLVEQRDGRTLGPNEIVHHLDSDQFNNDPENLTVLTRAEHMRLHGRDKKRRWTPEEQERALTLRGFGMTIQEVAWALGRSYSGTPLQLAKLTNGALLAA